MTETKVLIAAAVSMVVISTAIAALLFALNVSPMWVIVGGTGSGIAVYIAWCTFGRSTFVHRVATEDEQNA